eukprot:CAMPEP_0201476464 /NCGR_PEP_ID=MMETSP0151_2-20130828/1661_1 /ASSEMBLY_ACC=CAM_ASM_000257 /TAXON_ID=200890 /ORGANISM="Paramoeba atlantica, Strain 621/1 / CCAP 1560/9" /LENGTH=284 /DNA_ID=CAMNT_0047856827 /DNA_START=17 /DNA_END=871 /DNA_ORIENTATION=-
MSTDFLGLVINCDGKPVSLPELHEDDFKLTNLALEGKLPAHVYIHKGETKYLVCTLSESHPQHNVELVLSSLGIPLFFSAKGAKGAKVHLTGFCFPQAPDDSFHGSMMESFEDDELPSDMSSEDESSDLLDSSDDEEDGVLGIREITPEEAKQEAKRKSGKKALTEIEESSSEEEAPPKKQAKKPAPKGAKCEACGKAFPSDLALNQHKTAKHKEGGAPASPKSKPGSPSLKPASPSLKSAGKKETPKKAGGNTPKKAATPKPAAGEKKRKAPETATPNKRVKK